MSNCGPKKTNTSISAYISSTLHTQICQKSGHLTKLFEIKSLADTSNKEMSFGISRKCTSMQNRTLANIPQETHSLATSPLTINHSLVISYKASNMRAKCIQIRISKVQEKRDKTKVFRFNRGTQIACLWNGLYYSMTSVINFPLII